MEKRASGWYPDPDTGRRRFFDGEVWLDIPDPNINGNSSHISNSQPKKSRKKVTSNLLIFGGALVSMVVVIFVIAIIQLQSGASQNPSNTNNDFQQIKRNQCFDEKMRTLRATVEGDSYAVEARLICNSLYP
jgi:hypothetical protein